MSSKCVSYYRTSSLSNVGEEKDSLKRQKSVVHRFCDNNGYEIESEFYETMRGDGEILSRPVFMEMLIIHGILKEHLAAHQVVLQLRLLLEMWKLLNV